MQGLLHSPGVFQADVTIDSAQFARWRNRNVAEPDFLTIYLYDARSETGIAWRDKRPLSGWLKSLAVRPLGFRTAKRHRIQAGCFLLTVNQRLG